MEGQLCEPSSALVEVTDDALAIDVIEAFAEPVDLPLLTKVFQLRVERAKNHLDNLRTAFHRLGDDEKGRTDQLIASSVEIAVSHFLDNGDSISLAQLLTDSSALVLQLECDRNYTEAEIVKQKAKVEQLLHKISNISIFRMEMLPSAVQKEHEACSNDISELQWHIKQRTQVEKKLRQKRNRAAEVNAELREEIGALRERIPLMQEKLELEENMMARIQETKEKLLEESEMTAERLRITKEKHEDANRKMNLERQHIKRDLDKANKALNAVQKTLQHGEKEHVKLLDFRARSEEKIRQNNLDITRLITDNESKKAELIGLEETVDKLERKDRELQTDNTGLINSYKDKQEFFKEQESEQDEIRETLNNTSQELDQKLVGLRRTNKQMEEQIENIRESNEKSIAATEKFRHKIKSSKEEIRNAKERCLSSIDEFNKTSKDHAVIKHRLAKENRRMQEIEDQLRQSIVEIEKSIKQEIMTKANFKIKMVTDSQDLETSKKVAFDKQKDIQKVADEALLTAKEAHSRVTDLEAQHRICSEELKQLRGKYESILENKESMRKAKSVEIERLNPIHEELQRKLEELAEKEEHVEWEIKTINSELADILSSYTLIVKSKKKLQESLLTLDKDHDSIALELDMCRKQLASVEDAISRIGAQSSRLRTTHEKYLRERRSVLRNFETELEEALIENKKLAAHYRTSQTDFYLMQDAFLDVIQEQLWGEETVKNIKEVQRLQRFMHNNMDLFFSLKLMYDDDQFHDLLQESGRSQDKIKRLKDEYSTYVEKMRQFLRNNFFLNNQMIECEE